MGGKNGKKEKEGKRWKRRMEYHYILKTVSVSYLVSVLFELILYCHEENKELEKIDLNQMPVSDRIYLARILINIDF